jgi:hypothetical protein
MTGHRVVSMLTHLTPPYSAPQNLRPTDQTKSTFLIKLYISQNQGTPAPAGVRGFGTIESNSCSVATA